MKNIFEQALPETSAKLSEIMNEIDIQNLAKLFNTEKYNFLRAADTSIKRKILRLLSEMDDSAFDSYEGFVQWVSNECRGTALGESAKLSEALFIKLKELKTLFQREATEAINSKGETAKDFFSSTIDGWKQRLFGWASSTTTKAEGLYNSASLYSNPVSYIQKRIDDLRSDTSFFGVIKTLLLKVAKFFAEILFPPTTPPSPAVGERRGPIDSASFGASAAAPAPAAHAAAAVPAASASKGGLLAAAVGHLRSYGRTLFGGSQSASPVQGTDNPPSSDASTTFST